MSTQVNNEPRCEVVHAAHSVSHATPPQYFSPFADVELLDLDLGLSNHPRDYDLCQHQDNQSPYESPYKAVDEVSQQQQQQTYGMLSHTATTFSAGDLDVNVENEYSERLFGQDTVPGTSCPSHPQRGQPFIYLNPPRPQHEKQVPYNHRSDSLVFTGLDEAISSMPAPDWQCPSNDNTIPTNDEQRQQWVIKLLNAVNNVTDALDKQSTAHKKHWYDPCTGPSKFYSAVDKEILCWDILDLTERLHRDGPVILPSFDPVFWKLARKSRDWSFYQRMEKIVELLTYSKARCEKLLAGQGIHTVVSTPGTLVANTKANKKQNGKRQILLEATRATKKVKTERGAVVYGADGVRYGCEAGR